MKKQKQYSFLLSALLIPFFLISCNNAPDTTAAAAKKDTIEKQAAEEIPELPAHTDDGKPFFSVLYTVNGKAQLNFSSDKPLIFLGDRNMVVQLDSSHHLLKNGDMLNIYINAKKEGSYNIVQSNAGKDSATMILSFAQPDTYVPSFSPTGGKVTITKMTDKLCNGHYEAGAVIGNDKMVLKGSFYNASIN
jgi:hypothetical protein